MTPEEEWRAVVGFEDRYEVSNLGRVRSIDTRVYSGQGRTRIAKGRLLSLFLGDRYPKANLKVDGKQHNTYVHRMVAAAFIGPCPDGMEVCHNDGDQLNARLENLRYDTHSANMLDRRQHGTAFRRRDKDECYNGHVYADGSFYLDGTSGKKRCHECDSARGARDRAAKRAAEGRLLRAELTECKYGHPLDGRNKKQRFCITCARASNRRSRERRKAERVATNA